MFTDTIEADPVNYDQLGSQAEDVDHDEFRELINTISITGYDEPAEADQLADR